MLLNAFAMTMYQRRGNVDSVLSNVAMSTPSKGWNISALGMGANYTATLHFKVGYSMQSVALDPPFVEGDEITFTPQVATDAERMVVTSVTQCYKRGRLDHYEVNLT